MEIDRSVVEDHDLSDVAALCPLSLLEHLREVSSELLLEPALEPLLEWSPDENSRNGMRSGIHFH